MAVLEKEIQTGPVTVPQEKSKQGPVAPEKKSKQPQAAAVVARKQIKAPAFLNSPWLLAAVPLLVGGFWLVQNPWVITDNIDKPYALLAGPVLIGSLLVGWIVIKFFTAIERGCKLAVNAFLAAGREDGSAQFFWIVIAVFLAVSVFASGDFFSKLEHDAIPGLGYATALFIDLVAVQCMRARLNAGRLRDRRGQLLYLLGVLICASASAFANVYTSLATFTDKASGALPPWMPGVAPWFGLVFPALIVLLSMTADYTVDQTSAKLDPEQYKVQEGKRVKLLEYQRDLLRDRVTIEQDIDALGAKLRGQKERRVFFLVAWLFPLQVSGAHILERVERLYKPQLDALTQQNEWLRGQLAGLANAAQSAYVLLDQNVQHSTRVIDSQRDTDNRLLVERIEGLGVALRQELQGMIPAAPEPDYQALAQAVTPLLAPVFHDLRQEFQGMMPAAPKPAEKLDYTRLARTLAPLLMKEKETGLTDANAEVSELGNVAGNEQDVSETEERETIDLQVLTSSDPQDLASSDGRQEGENGAAHEYQGISLDALPQRPTVPMKEAAQLLGCEVKYVRTLRSRGKLKASSRNSELITVASIKSYLAESRRVVKV